MTGSPMGPEDQRRNATAEGLDTVGRLVMAGQQEEALALAVPLLDGLDPVRDRHDRMRVLGWIAPAQIDRGRLPECLAACDELIDLAGDDPSGTAASARCIRGVIRVRTGQEAKGLVDLRAAAAIAREPGLTPHDLFETLVVLASSSANIGLYEAAEGYYRASARLHDGTTSVARAYHTESWAWLHAEWGVTLQQEGDIEGARTHMDQVAELTALIRADAEEVLGEDGAAADPVVPDPGDDMMSANADTLLAFVAARTGRPEDALAIIAGLPGEPETRTRNDPALAAALAKALAQQQLGRPDLAIEHARRAAGLADRARAERWQAESYRLLGASALAVGETGVASAAAERYEALLDGLGWQQRLRSMQLAPVTG